MYFKWTKAAANLDAFKDSFDEIDKWYRVRQIDMYADYPTWVKLKLDGYIETRLEANTVKQRAQRKMWQFQGRMLALAQQQNQLAKDLRSAFPKRFGPYLSTNAILSEFHADVNSIDMGLLLQKYNSSLFRKET